jgi:hypothetical protein
VPSFRAAGNQRFAFRERAATGAITARSFLTPVSAISRPRYETVPPDEAFRPAQKLEPRFTAKHGGRLNMAEAELSAAAARCLEDRRIGDIDTLYAELSAWDTQRNRKQKGWTGNSLRRMPASNSSGSTRKSLSNYLDGTWRAFGKGLGGWYE